MSYVLTRARWTDYKIEMRTNVPVFKVKEATVRRRYSDFKVRLAVLQTLELGTKVVQRFAKISQSQRRPTEAYTMINGCMNKVSRHKLGSADVKLI